jgi:hypothetical protein
MLGPSSICGRAEATYQPVPRQRDPNRVGDVETNRAQLNDDATVDEQHSLGPRELSVAEQRYQAVLAVIADGLSVKQVVEKVGVSRQSLHAWLARYEAEGLEGLGDRSRRPRSCPNIRNLGVGGWLHSRFG